MVQNDGFRPMSDRIYVVGISAVEMDYWTFVDVKHIWSKDAFMTIYPGFIFNL
jgi:hypothetical protein